ncbi:DNA methyltransferase [Francisella tularensis]|uniref:DNA methyltransferase n=1 Tax=Francisella tularensis TaxID=263 RepID=UPI001C0F2D18|nr:DNA methyltransferase [Francisella tularensis]MBK2109328.1 site-specific DNA-methyltransferase [Francisella tularensis subsp. novicida FSC595]
MKYKQQFYSKLEDLYIGAKFDGQGGLAKLLNFKSQYFEAIKFKIENKINSLDLTNNTELYTKLFTFFDSYLSESGSVYFTDTPAYKNVYAKVYFDKEDTALFYKTKDLYYVKSQKVWQTVTNLQFDYTAKDKKKHKDNVIYDFIAGDYEPVKGNVKPSDLFFISKVDGKDKKITFKILEKKQNDVELNLTDIEGFEDYKRVAKFKDVYGFVFDADADKKEIQKYLIENDINIENEHIQKAISLYKKQSQVDYFIHKNARSFLREQYRIFAFNYLTDDTFYDQTRLDTLKKVQTVAYEIIDHIANFEDELKKIFEKPKFVLGTNYVISLSSFYGLTVESMLKKIKNHKNYSKQLAEWQELGFVDDNFDIEKIEDKYKHLPIDTKYFEDIKAELLSSIEDLDNSLNGTLIKSENYQAMQTILPKFKEKMQCIYIDPPFNTGSDFDYKDGYQDSTWLSIMYDRLSIAREFLRDDGSLYLHLDEDANYRGRELLDNIFGKDNFLNEIIWYYRRWNIAGTSLSKNHDCIFAYVNSKGSHFYKQLYIPKSEKSSAQGKSWKSIFVDGKRVSIQTDEPTKGVPMPDLWELSMINPVSSERNGFTTQKPETLIQRILNISSNPNHYIMDFFSGSGTTVATAHKLGRKWLGIEMGEHFDNVIIPRMKKVLFGFECGISKELKKEDKLTVGGIFKYYELEQYEDTLAKASYEKLEEKFKTLMDLTKEDKQNFANISFENNEKLAKDGLEIGKEEIFYRFEKLYPNVDIFECLSNFKGWDIYQIKSANEVVFKADGKLKTVHKKDITFDNYPELKAFIWW